MSEAASTTKAVTNKQGENMKITGQAPPRNGLTWGVKESFRHYIAGLPDGRQAVQDGATLGERGLYTFALAETAADVQTSDQTVIKYRGFVRFRGHFNMLVVIIEDPWIEFRKEAATLSVSDPFKDEPGSRLTLATLDFRPGTENEGTLEWTNIPAYLTEEGAVIFNDVYPAGEPLDTLDFSIPSRLQARSALN